MPGQWIHRIADIHACDKPKYGESLEKPVTIHDEWQCTCGKIWKVMGVTYGDQRDPIPQGFVTEWRRLITFGTSHL